MIFKVTAFIGTKRVVQKDSKKVLPNSCDGLRLDSVVLETVFESQEQVEDLIKFLEITKLTLPKKK